MNCHSCQLQQITRRSFALLDSELHRTPSFYVGAHPNSTGPTCVCVSPMRLDHTHNTPAVSRKASVSVKYVLYGVCSYSLFFISIVLRSCVCLHPVWPKVSELKLIVTPFISTQSQSQRNISVNTSLSLCRFRI